MKARTEFDEIGGQSAATRNLGCSRRSGLVRRRCWSWRWAWARIWPGSNLPADRSTSAVSDHCRSDSHYATAALDSLRIFVLRCCATRGSSARFRFSTEAVICSSAFATRLRFIRGWPNVKRIVLSLPASIDVELDYRRPVAAVQAMQNQETTCSPIDVTGSPTAGCRLQRSRAAVPAADCRRRRPAAGRQAVDGRARARKRHDSLPV